MENIPNTINIDIEIVYYWFDHLILRQNGDAVKVNNAIQNGDYNTFMKYYNYYNYEYKYDNNGGSIIFFPDVATIYYQDENIGYIDITNPIGFNMICYNEMECG